MKFVRTGKVWLGWLLGLGLSGVGPWTLQAATSLSADEVIQKAVARAQQAGTKPGHAGYSYTKCTLTEELDAEGKVKERNERVYQVFFQARSTYLKLVSV